MQAPVHADLEFKTIIYVIAFVFWIISQVAASAKKKQQQQKTLTPRRDASPDATGEQPQTAPSSLDSELKNLLEQLTGQTMPSQSAPPPPRPRPAAPPPVPSRVFAAQQSQRRASMAMPMQQKTARQVSAAGQPYAGQRTGQSGGTRPSAPAFRPMPATRQPTPFETQESAMPLPIVSAAAVSVHAKELSVNLPKMSLPSIRLPSVNLQHATARATRISWIRSPQSLRRMMTARFVLDPPRAFEPMY
jgi:hypothetical protein